MNDSPPREWGPPGDPLLNSTSRPNSTRRPGPSPARRRADGTGGARAPKRQHPAHGARVLALAASVTATAGIAGALALADDDSTTIASTPDTDPTSSAAATATTSDVAAPATTSIDVVEDTTPQEAVGESAVEDTSSVATTSPATTATPSTEATSVWADGVWSGTAEYTEWGDVQVEATIAGGQLVDVTVVQVPSDRHSARINDSATPVLEAQAIDLQSADLDIVSGATYTSRTYAASLQAALDEAQLAQQAAQS